MGKDDVTAALAALAGILVAIGAVFVLIKF